MTRIMTPEELRRLVVVAPAAYQHSLSLEVDSDLFERRVHIDIASANGDPSLDITDYVVRCVNMFFALDASFLGQVKAEIWEHYKTLTSEGGYGGVTDEMIAAHGGDEQAATMAFFGIADSDAAYAACTNILVVMYGGEQAPDMHDGFTLEFSVPWEEEHGIVLEVVDGAIADTF